MSIALTYTRIGAAILPERELTDEEKLTVTSQKTDATNIIYFQSDEPQKTYAEILFDLKNLRKEIISNRTDELMIYGFVFEGKTIGLRENEKTKWLAISKTPVKLPISIVSKEGTILIVTALNVDEFYSTAFDRAAKIEIDGGTLKYQINLATTIEAVNAIVDNRV